MVYGRILVFRVAIVLCMSQHIIRGTCHESLRCDKYNPLEELFNFQHVKNIIPFLATFLHHDISLVVEWLHFVIRLKELNAHLV